MQKNIFFSELMNEKLISTVRNEEYFFLSSVIVIFSNKFTWDDMKNQFPMTTYYSRFSYMQTNSIVFTSRMFLRIHLLKHH